MSEIESFRRFDGMCWPVPGGRTDEIEHILRYGSEKSMNEIRYEAASIVAAYSALVLATNARRSYVVKKLKGPKP